VLIPFALGRAVSARQAIGRIAMMVYTALAIGLVMLTFSRGGWIGMAAGIGTWFLLVLAQYNLLSVSGIKGWWSARGGLARVITLVVSGMVMVAALVTLALLLRSFSFSGRSTDLRTGIWIDAVTLFTEKPLTGSGLFTFGQGLSRLYSTPPNTPHSHAHNAPLLIAAELGIPGLIALTATLIVMGWGVRKHWREMDKRQRSTLAAAVGAVVGFGVHELTDIPAMSPAVALVGLLALAIMMMPPQPLPLTSAFRRLGHPAAMAVLWVVLLVTGLWSSRIYGQYVNMIDYALDTNDFRGAAEQMQAVIDADPVNIYKKEQGLLWGLAANGGDQEAARAGIAVYQRFVEVDPDYAVVWTNLAALYWQVGEREQALAAMKRAVELSPLSWQFAVNLGNYETAMGNDDAAGQAYDEAVRLYPDIILMPGLEHLAGRQSVIRAEKPLSVMAQVVMLLDEEQVEHARTVWTETPQQGGAGKYVIDAVLALAEGDRDSAEAALILAEQVGISRVEQVWTQIGWARLERFDGDEAGAEELLAAARQSLQRGEFEGDFVDGLSIAYAHFLRLGFQRQFIPQVYYPVDDPVQLHLLETT
jgi:tetratricopeptide (TPR) repeat protein